MTMSVTQDQTAWPPTVMEPVLATEPAYRGHVLKSLHSKARSLVDGQIPAVVSSVDIDEINAKPSVPYRLPRISPGVTPRLCCSEEESEDDVSEKMWGRFGYEDIVRIPVLTPSINRVSVGNNLRMTNSLNTSLAKATPRFRTAAIAPTKSIVKIKDEIDAYKSLLEKTNRGDNSDTAAYPEPTPSPVSRSASPTKSVKSIHWTLGSSTKKQLMFDKRGRGRAQGPFSREFTVTCFAPQNWLRLKLGRSKTMYH
ncbi:uncharacterized protein [Haliotis asinina]|uniref:uncharacterized protein isoform X1 n=1 Tax=Haliotis asinina TaxID=109174 RepID=UPI003531F59D